MEKKLPEYGEVVVAYDGQRYRCQSSLSFPSAVKVRGKKGEEKPTALKKKVVRVRDIWLYFAVAKDAQAQEDGKPLVWLSPDELALPTNDEQRIKLAYRRYLRNNLIRQRRSRRADRRILLPPDLPYDAEALLAG